MPISRTETYHPHRDGLADLAMSAANDTRLHAADPSVAQAVADAITKRIRHYGVNTETGEWLGTWSAEAIVVKILDEADARNAKTN